MRGHPPIPTGSPGFWLPDSEKISFPDSLEGQQYRLPAEQRILAIITASKKLEHYKENAPRELEEELTSYNAAVAEKLLVLKKIALHSLPALVGNVLTIVILIVAIIACSTFVALLASIFLLLFLAHVYLHVYQLRNVADKEFSTIFHAFSSLKCDKSNTSMNVTNYNKHTANC
jgi:hypothetical protein